MSGKPTQQEEEYFARLEFEQPVFGTNPW